MKTLEQVPLKPKDRLAVQRAVEILRARLPVERVILFGSKARGDDRRDSDIDLLVLTRVEVPWHGRQVAQEALYDVQLEMGLYFSCVFVTAEEWAHGISQALPLHDEVERDGVML